MLERVTIVNDAAVDVGAICEALVYYGHAELVMHPSAMAQLIERVGVNDAIRLVEHPNVRATLSPSIPALHSDNARVYPHRYISFSIAAEADGRALRDLSDQLEIQVRRKFDRSSVTKKQLARIVDAVDVQRSYEDLGAAGLADITDNTFATRLFVDLLDHYVPGYKVDRLRIDTAHDGTHFFLKSNIHYDEFNRIFKRLNPQSDLVFTDIFLAAHVATARTIMFHCGGSNTDLWIDGSHSTYIRNKVNSFFSKTERSIDMIDRFEDIHFTGRSVSEVVNGGHRTLADTLDLVDDAGTVRFKKWLAGAGPNADIIREYDKSVVGPSAFAKSVPGKALRLVTFGSAGAALDVSLGAAGIPTMGAGAVASGLASEAIMGAADKHIWAKLQLGWKPNQWISKQARPFLRPAE